MRPPLPLAALVALSACSALDLFAAPPADEAGCGDARRYRRDLDGDGFGAGDPVLACAAPAGHVAEGGDCDDARGDVHPGASEGCDGRDNDCDGAVDEAPEADAVCAGRAVRAGVCRGGGCVATCERDRGDCDGSLANGCEADLATSVAHCGACGMACGEGSPCVDGRCASALTAIAAGAGSSAGAGRSFTCAVRGGDRVAGRSPRVLCWGDNVDGQLGVDPETTPATRVPVSFELPIAGGSEQLALGGDGGCALAVGGARDTGELWCWGPRPDGGDPAPRRVLEAYNVQAVARTAGVDGRDSSCAIESSNGRLWCWGSNASGNLGVADAGRWVEEPALVSLGRRPETLAMGPTHTCVGSGPGVYCWGRNDLGQLGDGTRNARATPPPQPAFRAPAGTVLVRPVVGRDFSCALTEVDGDPTRRSLWCWGANPGNWFGAASAGAALTAPTPVAVDSLVDVAAGGGRWCARRADGVPACAGEVFYRGDARVFQGPTRTPALGGVSRFALGPDHACALLGTSEVLCWGDNAAGQLGDGTDARRRAPTPVPALRHRARVVAAAGDFVLLRADGSTDSRRPSLAARFAGITLRDLALDGLGGACAARVDGALMCSSGAVPADALDGPARQVAVSRERVGSAVLVVCARTAEGRVRCLRAAPRTSTVPGESAREFVALSPAVAPSLDAVGIAGSPLAGHFCAWNALGEAHCWGDNADGEAAPTRPEASLASAERVAGLDDVAEVAVGPRVSCARRAAGGVACWGRTNLPGAQGPAPVDVPGITDATHVTLGAAHGCALRRGGRVACWGANGFGQLGDGTTIDRAAAVDVRGLEDADDVTAGADFTCARRRTGQVLCWGRNDDGRLDDGTYVDRAFPGPTLQAP